MLTEEENRFIDYWERNRDEQKKTARQFLIGIPLGLLFAVPICINFFSGWYKRASMVRNTEEFNPLVLIIAMIIIISFVAIFSKRHQWEMREQKYQELLSKKKQETVDNLVETK
ncbi:MAG TPA: hypothetical protein VKT28_05760 [Puia sp.]|nr:hypothetical protein [Puia sp.]